eukprot:358299-Chlamydomonas_euryale.AAC.10
MLPPRRVCKGAMHVRWRGAAPRLQTAPSEHSLGKGCKGDHRVARACVPARPRLRPPRRTRSHTCRMHRPTAARVRHSRSSSRAPCRKLAAAAAVTAAGGTNPRDRSRSYAESRPPASRSVPNSVLGRENRGACSRRAASQRCTLQLRFAAGSWVGMRAPWSTRVISVSQRPRTLSTAPRPAYQESTSAHTYWNPAYLHTQQCGARVPAALPKIVVSSGEPALSGA